jgi:hypothetical protein
VPLPSSSSSSSSTSSSSSLLPSSSSQFTTTFGFLSVAWAVIRYVIVHAYHRRVHLQRAGSTFRYIFVLLTLCLVYTLFCSHCHFTTTFGFLSVAWAVIRYVVFVCCVLCVVCCVLCFVFCVLCVACCVLVARFAYTLRMPVCVRV